MDDKTTESGFWLPRPPVERPLYAPPLVDDVVPVIPPEPPPAERRRPDWWRPAFLGGVAGAVAGALVAGGIVIATDDDGGGRSSVTRPTSVLEGEALDIRGVLDAVEPGVVSINVAGRISAGAGSGMVIDDDGHVLTNAHVVRGAQRITVSLADGREEAADLVASMPSRDVALLKLRDPGELQPVQLGESSALQVGDEVVAVGNALNLGETPSVTTGIVSALCRSISAENGISLDNLIQTDAAINPGNSGGPLVNAFGEVIGVNTAIAGGAENIGFAIAIDAIEPLLEDLKAGQGEVQGGPFLGVSTADVAAVTPAVRERLGIEAEAGAFVQQVVPGSGADAAGLRAGDVIVELNGEEVDEAADIARIVQGLRRGQEVELTVEREGELETVTATIGSREDG